MTAPSSRLRLVLLKCLGLVLGLLLLIPALLSLGYPVLTAMSNLQGGAAKVTAVKPAWAPHSLATSRGGVYRLSVLDEDKKPFTVTALYPQWPGHWAPQKGDEVRIWPPAHPRFAAVETDGWGWLILGSLLVLGFLLLEFVFLSFSLR